MIEDLLSLPYEVRLELAMRQYHVDAVAAHVGQIALLTARLETIRDRVRLDAPSTSILLEVIDRQDNALADAITTTTAPTPEEEAARNDRWLAEAGAWDDDHHLSPEPEHVQLSTLLGGMTAEQLAHVSATLTGTFGTALTHIVQKARNAAQEVA